MTTDDEKEVRRASPSTPLETVQRNPMRDQQFIPDWTSQAWLHEASAWIEDVLAQYALVRSGLITQTHVRPWSTVLQVPTEAGLYYFKAVVPALVDEILLTAALAEWLPRDTLSPLAIEPKRAWMLLPDGGPRLRELFRADRDIAHWSKVLPVYAGAQIALCDRVPDMLALGTPDRRLTLLPDLYRQLLRDMEQVGVDDDAQLTGDERMRLRALDPRLAEWCAELAAQPIPESLNHGDLHDGNVFLPDSEPVFFDWGDASVTHPFVSVRTVFVSVEITLDLPEGGAFDMPFVEAYLAPWQRFAPAHVVRHTFQLAQQLAPLVSALSWYRGMQSLPAAEQRDHATAVSHLLRELLQGAKAENRSRKPE